MRESVFVGVALIAVSALHLVSAALAGELPATWPVKPLTRCAQPRQFWATSAIFTLAGVTGAFLAIWPATRE